MYSLIAMSVLLVGGIVLSIWEERVKNPKLIRPIGALGILCIIAPLVWGMIIFPRG